MHAEAKLKWQTFLFILVAFTLGCNEFMIVGITSDIARTYQASMSQVGILVTAFSIVYAVTTPIMATLTSRFNRYKVLISLMGVFLAGTVLAALAPTLSLLFVSRIISAACSGTILSLILVFGDQVAPPEKRAVTVAYTFAGFSVASVVGLPVGTAISMYTSWHICFWLIALLAVLVIFMTTRLIPRTGKQTIGSLFKQLTLLADPRIILGVSIVAAVYGAQYSFYTYIRPLITHTMGFSPSALNWILFVLGIMFIVGNVVSAQIADHGGLKLLPYVNGGLAVLLLFLAPAVQSPWLGVLDLAVICIFLSSQGATLQVFFMNVASKDHPEAINLASSLEAIFTNVGVALGSLSASLAYGTISIAHMGYMGAVYGLIGAICSLVLYRITRLKNAEK